MLKILLTLIIAISMGIGVTIGYGLWGEDKPSDHRDGLIHLNDETSVLDITVHTGARGYGAGGTSDGWAWHWEKMDDNFTIHVSR